MRVAVIEIKMFIFCHYKIQMDGFSIEIGVIQALEAIPCVDVLNKNNTNSIPPKSVIK